MFLQLLGMGLDSPVQDLSSSLVGRLEIARRSLSTTLPPNVCTIYEVGQEAEPLVHIVTQHVEA